MAGIAILWLPILLSSVIVFIASSIIHMLTPWHKGDFPKLPNEEKVLDALRPLAIPPGDYMMPRPSSREEMGSPAFADKLNKGPVLMMTVWPNGRTSMATSLILWFLYCVAVSIFVAYCAWHGQSVGDTYMQVFRFVAVTAFAGYCLALWQMSIWYRRSWSITIKATVDGLIYGLLTAGVFGWLWPR